MRRAESSERVVNQVQLGGIYISLWFSVESFNSSLACRERQRYVEIERTSKKERGRQKKRGIEKARERWRGKQS